MWKRIVAIGLTLTAVAKSQQWPLLFSFAAPTGVCQGFQPGAGPVTFGFESMACVGDVNGDGFDDIAGMVLPLWRCPPADLWGSPYRITPSFHGVILAGGSGAVLRTFDILSSAFILGYSTRGHCVAAGDVNGDGYADILAASGDVAEVRSGLNGAVLHRYAEITLIEHQANGLAGLGDVDGDGRDDFAIAPPTAVGSVRVYSGRTGAILQTLPGQFVTGPGDLDADGRPDIAIADPTDQTSANGTVTVYSGANWAVIHRWFGVAGETFGASLDGIGDVNGDRVPDIVVGATAAGGGAAYVFDGAQGSLLHTLTRPAPYSYGAFVRGLGDVDGDGVGDVLVRNTQTTAVRGSSDVYSGSTMRMIASNPDGLAGSAGDFNRDGRVDLLRTSGSHLEVRSMPATTGFTFRRGVGCSAGSSPLTISSRGLPLWNSTFSVDLGSVPPGAAVVLHVGDPVNVALHSLGMWNCTLFCAPFIAFPHVATAQRAASHDFNITANTAPLGAQLDMQWAVLAPGVNPVGAALSDALTVVIGQ